MAGKRVKSAIENLRGSVRNLADPSKLRGLKQSGKMIKKNLRKKLKAKKK